MHAIAPLPSTNPVDRTNTPTSCAPRQHKNGVRGCSPVLGGAAEVRVLARSSRVNVAFVGRRALGGSTATTETYDHSPVGLTENFEDPQVKKESVEGAETCMKCTHHLRPCLTIVWARGWRWLDVNNVDDGG
jgi:hypothetical protein